MFQSNVKEDYQTDMECYRRNIAKCKQMFQSNVKEDYQTDMECYRRNIAK
jgi:hypothetical protein